MNVRPCALIVEDELFVALDLEDAMVEMGFYVCGVAATQDRAYSLAATLKAHEGRQVRRCQCKGIRPNTGAIE
jgi:hypothetical protein